MTKHDEGRRAFLVGTAIGAGAAASVALVPEALAKDHPQHHAAAGAPAMAPPAGHAMHDMSGGHGAFFNEDDTRTITALTERLMPGAPGMPGATDAGVTNYIDLALAGAYEDQQYFYRCGLAQLDAHCTQAYGKEFRRLAAAQQDETIAALQQGKVTEFVWPTAQAFFATAAHAYDGRNVRRPGLWRQQRLRRLAARRVSRRAAAVHAGRHAEQTGLHARAHYRPAIAGEGGLSHGN